MPKATSDPKAIQALDRKRTVLTMLRQGFDIRSICEKVDLDEVYVRTLAREEMEYLNLATQEMQQHFVALTFARSERIMSRLLPVFDEEPPAKIDFEKPEDYQTAANRYERRVGDGLRNFVNLARLQKEILQVKGPEEKKRGDINIEHMAVIQTTMTAESDFYREALDSIQTDLLGETFPEMQARYLDEGDSIILPDDRLEKIEAAIEKLNVPNDSAEAVIDD